MGMEVVWVRQFSPFLGTVVYAFASILAIYLGATFAGAIAYRRWSRARSAARSAPLARSGARRSCSAAPAAVRGSPARRGDSFAIGLARLRPAIAPFCAASAS
jgi:hypothetical protein